ncbi:hypothetical protein EVAR_20907_1 [Eumeta japonica]|uniref:Uncharacterized protein n=1 Tax=Eumeta variegata TaxID=151549 RepID=A0A4C1UXG5_EUMVA|nr:hypothetical protein EVAR_20907_1 [Eumeta japonica]
MQLEFQAAAAAGRHVNKQPTRYAIGRRRGGRFSAHGELCVDADPKLLRPEENVGVESYYNFDATSTSFETRCDAETTLAPLIGMLTKVSAGACGIDLADIVRRVFVQSCLITAAVERKYHSTDDLTFA